MTEWLRNRRREAVLNELHASDFFSPNRMYRNFKVPGFDRRSHRPAIYLKFDNHSSPGCGVGASVFESIEDRSPVELFSPDPGESAGAGRTRLRERIFPVANRVCPSRRQSPASFPPEGACLSFLPRHPRRTAAFGRSRLTSRLRKTECGNGRGRSRRVCGSHRTETGNPGNRWSRRLNFAVNRGSCAPRRTSQNSGGRSRVDGKNPILWLPSGGVPYSTAGIEMNSPGTCKLIPNLLHFLPRLVNAGQIRKELARRKIEGSHVARPFKMFSVRPAG